jgi:hypothetical protein
VRTYLRISGKTGQRGSIAEQFVVYVGASLADPIVAKLVSPETFLDLLGNGRPSDVFSEDTPSVNAAAAHDLSRRDCLLLPSRPRWGRLQRQAQRAFVVHDDEALTSELAEWCWARRLLLERLPDHGSAAECYRGPCSTSRPLRDGRES